MHWRIYSYINPYFFCFFQEPGRQKLTCSIGRLSQSINLPMTHVIITVGHWYMNPFMIYGFPRIQIYDIRIPTDSKQWYTDSNWYDTWYTDTQTVSPMIRDTPIHGLYHLRISIPKIPGYSVIHKQYPWYSDTGMTHWPPGITICIL